jgi:hypothetical protein
MDIGLRIMNQIDISTSLTLVSFLSKSLNDYLTTLDMTVVSVLVLLLTYVVGNEYVLSSLSRRLAVLLIMERLRPLFINEISQKSILELQGLIIGVGILCVLAVIPTHLKKNQEIAMLIQSFVYLYSDIFSFLAKEKNNQLQVLIMATILLGITVKYHDSLSSVWKFLADVGAIIATSVILQIIQLNVDSNPATAILQNLLIINILHYTQFKAMQSVEDYMIYNIQNYIQTFIKTDVWYWIAILGFAIQVMIIWLPLQNFFVQITILTVVNKAVSSILGYIKELAIHDTVITLKTSAIVLQFIVREITREFLKTKT